MATDIALDARTDSEIIDELGGPAKVAELLGYDGGIARIHNWRTRGIPHKVLVEHPEVFGSRGAASADVATAAAVHLLRTSFELAKKRLPSALMGNLKMPSSSLNELGEFLLMLSELLDKFPEPRSSSRDAGAVRKKSRRCHVLE